uniref:Coatomer subunit zeta n=1 Tax=Papio anubis TaxID=9555 RepID=A0A8I5NAG6_PAPAN
MEALILEPSLYTVKAILILDNDGDRLFAKYYDDTYPSVKEQKAFEKNIFNKTHRTDSEIALLEGLTVVYKSSIDLYFYVIGSSYENELMLMAVLNCLFDSLSQMLRVKMSPLRSRPCLRCCSQPKNRSSGHSFGEDPTVPGSSSSSKNSHVCCEFSSSSPIDALRVISGITGILKSPFCLWLSPPTSPTPSLLFFILLAVLGVKLPAYSDNRAGEAPSFFLDWIMLTCSPALTFL